MTKWLHRRTGETDSLPNIIQNVIDVIKTLQKEGPTQKECDAIKEIIKDLKNNKD